MEAAFAEERQKAFKAAFMPFSRDVLPAIAANSSSSSSEPAKEVTQRDAARDFKKKRRVESASFIGPSETEMRKDEIERR
jgi:hypothetical protein